MAYRSHSSADWVRLGSGELLGAKHIGANYLLCTRTVITGTAVASGRATLEKPWSGERDVTSIIGSVREMECLEQTSCNSFNEPIQMYSLRARVSNYATLLRLSVPL
eukprot:3769596-Rhodomonas_salina.1